MRATQPAFQKYLIFQSLTDEQKSQSTVKSHLATEVPIRFCPSLLVVISQHVALNFKGHASIGVPEFPLGYHRARRL